ncbi:MAG: oxaloacetate decarboxylase [Lautropia sp.]
MTSLRSRLASADIIAAPGVYDAFSARLMEDLDFPAVYLGGNAVGLQLAKGQPFVDASDMIRAVAQVRSAVAVPIVVDAAAGFGEAAHTYRAVRDLERAGASALHVDDQIHPKRAHYHLGRAHLVPVDAMVAKLEAAVAARRSDETLIIARTDALRSTRSLPAAMTRAQAYAGTGIDALLVLDAGVDEVGALRAAIPGLPLAWMAGPQAAAPSLAELSTAGFRLALYPFQSIVAVTGALLSTWGAFAVAGRVSPPSQPVKALLDTALRVADMPTYWDIERRTVEPPSA